MIMRKSLPLALALACLLASPEAAAAEECGPTACVTGASWSTDEQLDDDARKRESKKNRKRKDAQLTVQINGYVWFAIVVFFVRRYLAGQAARLDGLAERRVAVETERTAEQARLAHYRQLHDTVLATLTAIAQSCGNRTLCQARSSNPGASAPFGSPRTNFQSRLKFSTRRSARAGAATKPTSASARRKARSERFTSRTGTSRATFAQEADGVERAPPLPRLCRRRQATQLLAVTPRVRRASRGRSRRGSRFRGRRPCRF